MTTVTARQLLHDIEDEDAAEEADWAGAGGEDDLRDRRVLALVFTRPTPPPFIFPAVPAALATDREDLRAELAAAEELAANALAKTTRDSYTSHVAAYARWCAARNIDPRKATPTDVALHLSRYALAWDENDRPARDGEDRLVPAVAAVSVGVRVAAIAKAYELLGLRSPVNDPEVNKVLQGIRRSFGVRPRYAKAALDMAGLRQVLAIVEQVAFEQLRDRTVALLRARTGATGGQIARLSWVDVEFYTDHAVVELPPDRRGGPRRRVTVRTHRDEDLCLVASLQELRTRAPHLKQIVVAATGRPLSRQAVYQLLDRVLGEVDVTALPGVIDRELRARLAPLAVDRSPAALRDAAVLLTGWFAALRRGEISGLRWRDVALELGEWRIHLGATKTDQEGEGYVLYLPLAADGTPCPAIALTRWRDYIAGVVGGDPCRVCPDEPVFPAMDRHGNLRRRKVRSADRPGFKPFDGKGINELVQRLVIAAGLAKPPTDP